MADVTGIEWTDKTFNGWWGCTRVSPGCDHCYAADLDKRTGGDHWGAGVARRRTSDHNWNAPRRWNRRAEKDGYRFWVFASSMCDVFDNEVPDDWRSDLFDLIRETPLLRWQILTKRIGNAEKMLPADWPQGFGHVGIMATMVDQEEIERDGPKLMAVPAAWRGISYEPALGPIRNIPEVDWLIIGGESGSKAREFRLEWAMDAMAECYGLGIRVFVKQLGARWSYYGDRGENGRGDSKGKRMENWPLPALRVRQMPYDAQLDQEI